MTMFPFMAVILMAISLDLGLVRGLRSPAIEDRMMSAQFVGTTGVGLLTLLGFLLAMPASIDEALMLVLLAAVAVIALTQRERPSESHHD